MNLPGFDFHPLKGFKPTRYSVHVNGPWCDGAAVWTRMQAAYDTWHAERAEDVSGIPTIRAKAA